MKTMSLKARSWFVGVVVLAMAALASQALADSVPQTITVMRLKGTARYSNDGKTWNPLRKGDVLKPGCLIETAPNAYVDILLGDRDAALAAKSHNPNSTLYSPEEQRANAIRIFENSALSVDKLTLEKNSGSGDEVSDTQLDLRAGQILGNVKKMSASSKYEVKIPNGVAGIRGTIYLIGAGGVVTVVTGSVVIAIVGPDGTVITRVVTAHERYNPETNTISQVPPAEERLLLDIIRIFNIPPNFPPVGPIPGTPILWVSPN